MDSILITNSQAPGAIGDAMAAVPALAEVAKKQESLEIYWTANLLVDLFTIPNAKQYRIGENPPKGILSLDIQSVYAGFHSFGISMPEAWARAMGITLPDDWRWPRLARGERDNKIAKLEAISNLILVSPHSYSDFGTGYKHWPMGRWLQLIDQLHDSGFVVGFLGGAADPTTLPCEYEIKGSALQEVAALMQHSCATITIDNGMGWLAQAVGAPHIHLLSVNQTREWAWDPGPHARNLADVKSTSAAEVYAAVIALVGRR